MALHPGRLNISDGATRSGLTPEQPLPENWIDGPPFLHQPEEEWPKDIPWVAMGEELRANKQARTHLNVTAGQLGGCEDQTAFLIPLNVAGGALPSMD